MRINRRYVYLVGMMAGGLFGATPMPEGTKVPAAEEGLPIEVRLAVEARCVKCHGPEKQKSGLRLDTLSTDFFHDEVALETWAEVLELIEQGEMPPDDATALDPGQRHAVVEWITQSLDRVAADESRRHPGVVMRRLNKNEYRHTLADLLGVSGDFGADLPADPISKSGFSNDGETLGMSALQLELYLNAARKVLAHVLVEGPAPIRRQHETVEQTAAAVVDLKFGTPTTVLGRFGGYTRQVLNPPQQHEFLVRVTARAVRQPDRAWPVLKVVFGHTAAGAIAVHETVGEQEVDSDVSQDYTFRGDVSQFPLAESLGPKWVQVVALSNSLEDGRSPQLAPKENPDEAPVFPSLDPDFPKIVIEKLEFISGADPVWPPVPHQRILFAAENEGTPVYYEEVIRRFLRRAWRRPPNAVDVIRYREHFERLTRLPMSAAEAWRETLAVALVSPNFLYLVEPELEADTDRRLDDFELAARLSYFLWSSMPDERLLQLAERGGLRESGVLGAEVDRMLADPKSARMVEHFTTEWLDLDGLERVAINPEYYPKFEDKLKQDMIGEAQAFFAEILYRGESAQQLIAADWTMLNANLARHYGIPGPESQKFERVSLQGTNRSGGVLGQGAMHLLTSTGDDSNPIKRAVWIRERLLDDPPRAPPPDVPALPINDPEFARLSLREQMAVHRRKPSCANCHESIDPWGIALDHFDAVGHWRDTIRRPSGGASETGRAWLEVPVDASATLPDGTELTGLSSLNTYLLKVENDKFSRAFTTKLLSYALGREVGRRDRNSVQHLTATFVAYDHHLPTLIREIVASDCFQTH